MSDSFSPGASSPLRALVWGAALLVIFGLVYKIAFRKQADQRAACVESAQARERTASARASVDRYLACAQPAAAKAQGAPASQNPRCRYAGIWTSTRGSMVYEIRLDPDGKFVAEPVQNAPPGAGQESGSWGVAGNTFAWAYDSGPVYPPDLNPISNERDGAFTLTEVNGATTQFMRVEKSASPECS